MQQRPPSCLSLRNAVFELLPDPILVVDPAGLLLDANAAARQLFHIDEPIPDQYLPATLQAQLPDSVWTTPPVAVPTAEVALSRGGEPQRYLCAATPLHDEAGVHTGTILRLQALAERERDPEPCPSQPDAATLQATEFALLKIGVALTSGLEMEAVLTTILDECRSLLPVDTLYVALFDGATETYQLVLFWDQGTYRSLPEQIALKTRRSLTRAVIESATTLYLADISDPATASAYPNLKIADAPTRSYLGTPLIVRGEVVGVLSIQHLAPERYTDEHVRLLEIIASQAAVAVENARLYALVRHELATERAQMAERLALATEVTGIGVWDWQREGDQLVWDDQMRAMHGIAPGTTVTFDAWRAAIHPDDLAASTQVINAAVVSGTHANVEYRVVHQDGSLRYVLGVGGVIRDAGGTMVRQIGVCRDITAQKQIEADLRESEDRFRTMAEMAPIPLILLRRADWTVLYANPAASQASGFALAELIGTAANSYVTATVPDRAELQRMLATGEPVHSLEVQLVTASGEHFYVLLSVGTGAYQGEPVAMVALSDITDRKQAELALAASEARLKAIIENTQDDIWSIDRDYRLLACNSSFVHGIELQIGRTIAIGDSTLSDLFPPAISAFWQPHYDRALAGEAVALEIASSLRPGGVLDCRLNPIFDANGAVTGVACRTFDITDRLEVELQLRESLERLRLATEAAEIGIWSWNLAEGSLEWDARMFALYGISKEASGAAIPYALWRARVHPDDIELADPAHGDANRLNPEWDGTFRIFLPDGLIRHIYASSVMEYDREGRPARMIGVNRDVTAQKKYERLLQDTNAELEQRVAARTEQLAVANRELAIANQLKDEFLAAVSHELRTPLSGIIAIADAFLMQAGSLSEARQMRYAQILTRSGDRLLELVNGILRYINLLGGRRPIRREPCWLAETAAIALVRIHARADEKSIHIEAPDVPTSLKVYSDAEALLEILAELLGNAVKFTPEGGTIGMEIELDAAGALQLFVWDTGIGITPESRSRIFVPFVQGDGSLARRYEGAGLGLAYVKQLVEAMGGSIEVASEMDKGSRFTVTLPQVSLAAA